MRLIGASGQIQAGLGTRRAQYGILGGTLAAQEKAILATQGVTGYGRHEQAEDIFRHIALRRGLATIGAEGKARLSVVGSKQTENAARQRELRMEHEKAEHEHLKLRNRRATHIDKHQSLEEELNLRKQTSAAYERQMAIEQQLQATRKQGLDLRLEKEQAIYQTQQQQHNALRGQVEALGQAIQKEQRRKRDLTENLALMHPLKLRTAVGVQRKFQQGLPMTQREIEFMRGMPQVFGGQLQQVAARRAANNPLLQELMRGTQQNRREQELRQQKVALENTINMKVQIDEQGLARGWTKEVEKAFLHIANQLEHSLKVRLSEIENKRMTQQRSVFPQF